MNTTTRRGRPRKGELRLSKDAILTAALAVVDEDGVAAVSMRTVAQRLEVDAKSLYHHVDGKEGLLDAIAGHLLGRIVVPEQTGQPDVDLRAIAQAFRRAARAHPQAASLVLTRQLPSAAALVPAEAVLSVLRRAGAAPDEAVHLLRALLAVVVGSLAREGGAGPAFGVEDDEGIARRRADLEQSGLPAVVEAAPDLARCDHEAEFEFAVDLAVAAVLQRLTPRR
ncbi:TetR/AcrR family transcriptional regulator [Amycolatopsis benzoatilytica]|uniref:TetR/AcrR family transcriptional regulator n=1 Tax=Amycolatopsis benzoatilytica TaxID=346045 RepID=UPI00035DA356|nr:TetR/AcrR family transcriptional regulator [Amycolatopsis benzoatilytica]